MDDEISRANRRAETRWRLRALHWGLVLAALALQLDCVSPQIPLPPPEIGQMDLQVTSGTPVRYKISGKSGSVPPRASVSVQRRSQPRQGDGVLTRAKDDGSFVTPEFAAADGAELEIYYVTVEQRASEPACGVIVGSGAAAKLTPCRSTSSARSPDQGISGE